MKIDVQLEPRFLRDYKKLSKLNQDRTKKALKDLEDDQLHRSLRIKKMKGKDDVWEGHISQQCVFTFHWIDGGERRIVNLRRVGTHAIYKNP